MGMPFPEPYMTLFNASSVAIKGIDRQFQVGGPASANLANVKEFVDAATSRKIAFDFVSTHHYPTDSCKPQGSKWDPDCWNNGVKASRESIPSTIPFYMTEFNVGCCLGYAEHDTSNAAAFALRAIGKLDGTTDLLSWWTFTDVFEEGGFPQTEFSNIYGLMTVHGVPKPGWRGFQLLAQAGDRRVATNISEPNVATRIIDAFATVKSTSPSPSDSLKVYLSSWSVPATDNRTVTVQVLLPEDQQSALATTATVWRIDEDHANPLAAWKAMGSPAEPSAEQLDALIVASAMHPNLVATKMTSATTVELDIQMPPNAAVLVDFGNRMHKSSKHMKTDTVV